MSCREFVHDTSCLARVVGPSRTLFFTETAFKLFISQIPYLTKWKLRGYSGDIVWPIKFDGPGHSHVFLF